VEHQLNDELVAALGAAGPDHERLRRAAGLLRGDPDGLHRLLGLVAGDTARAAQVARDSYWHANGFAKLTLQRSTDPAFKLRLHIWTRGEATPTPTVGGGNTHTHRWAFSSVVLCGGLDVQEFEEVDDPADPKTVVCHKLAYDSPDVDLAGTLRPVGRCLLRQTGSAVYGAGDLHGGRLETIHRVAPKGGQLAATLFLQGPNQSDTAWVYEEPGHTAVKDTGTAIEPAEVTALAQAVSRAYRAAVEGSR
jgi:hypothetical protein